MGARPLRRSRLFCPFQYVVDVIIEQNFTLINLRAFDSRGSKQGSPMEEHCSIWNCGERYRAVIWLKILIKININYNNKHNVLANALFHFVCLKIVRYTRVIIYTLLENVEARKHRHLNTMLCILVILKRVIYCYLHCRMHPLASCRLEVNVLTYSCKRARRHAYNHVYGNIRQITNVIFRIRTWRTVFCSATSGSHVAFEHYGC